MKEYAISEETIHMAAGIPEDVSVVNTYWDDGNLVLVTDEEDDS